MYIIELLAKFIKKEKTQKNNTLKEEIDYTEKCSHTFFPIDSTGEILACSKCGKLIHSNDTQKIKPNNPFVE